MHARLSLTLDSTKSKHFLPFREDQVNDSPKVSLSGIMTNTTTKGQTFMSKKRSQTYGNVWGSFYPRLIVHLKHIIYYYHMRT